MKLKISDDLSLPLDAVTQKFAILGTSGSGKSYTAMKLGELMLDAGAQIVAIDPVGVWWSLRLAANGNSPTYGDLVVFGGDHGDLPLVPESGALIGKLLAERRISAVLDVSQFLTGEMKRFLTSFAEQFFQSKKSHKSPVHLFLEECQTYLPQNAEDREDAKLLNRWERLIKFFRNYGGGTSMISQQPQSVNKKVLNLADTMFAMRIIGSHERKAILAWVKDVIESESDLVSHLPRLDTGVAHLWSPSWLKISRDIKILPRKTFDASKTPEMGVEAAEPRPLTPIDVAALKAEMVEVVEGIKENDPKELKAKIRQLELAAKEKKPEFDEDCVKEAVQQALERQRTEHNEILRAIVHDDQRLRDGITAAAGMLNKLKEIGCPVPVGGLQLIDRPVMIAKTLHQPKASQVKFSPAPAQRRPAGGSIGDIQLRPGACRMLAACAQWRKPISEAQVAAQAGVKRTGGSFSSYKSNLVTAGLISVNGGLWSATAEGMAYIGSNGTQSPQSTEEVLAIWKPKFRPGAARMLDVLISYGGESVAVETLAEQSGVSADGGSFSSYLSNLATADLIVKPQRGMVAANREALFL